MGLVTSMLNWVAEARLVLKKGREREFGNVEKKGATKPSQNKSSDIF